MSEPLLSARGLTKRYGRVTALDRCDFDLMPGEILAVIGDNGAGKSTLIKAISGAVVPDEGEVRLDGRPVRFTSPLQARDAGIETVYQTLAMSPALSIADNMFMGREIVKAGVMGRVFRKLDRARMEAIAREKLNDLGLMTIQNINQPVETLSGGQRQGVAVARAAAFGSKVIILGRAHGGPGREGEPKGPGPYPGRARAGHPDHPDLPQHAARLRGGRPHPCPSAGPAADGDRPEAAFDVGRGGLHDGGEGAGGDRRGVTPAALAARIAALPGARTLTAVVGPPASGKSTLAAAIVASLPGAALVPMDGFHLDDRILGPRGLLARKGAPETFDLGGLNRALDAIRAGGEVFVPLFDRTREIAIAAAGVVPAEARHVVVEGNWLLLDAPGWRDLGPWDLTVRLDAPDAILRARLAARWAHLAPVARAAKIDGNDLPNARLVRDGSRSCDIALANG